jgi:hypothetical protein
LIFRMLEFAGKCAIVFGVLLVFWEIVAFADRHTKAIDAIGRIATAPFLLCLVGAWLWLLAAWLWKWLHRPRVSPRAKRFVDNLNKRVREEAEDPKL